MSSGKSTKPSRASAVSRLKPSPAMNGSGRLVLSTFLPLSPHMTVPCRRLQTQDARQASVDTPLREPIRRPCRENECSQADHSAHNLRRCSTQLKPKHVSTATLTRIALPAEMTPSVCKPTTQDHRPIQTHVVFCDHAFFCPRESNQRKGENSMPKKLPPPASSLPPPTRCAIYTRKSTEERLDQEFNSLDAQREASEAFIASQKAEGPERTASRECRASCHQSQIFRVLSQSKHRTTGVENTNGEDHPVDSSGDGRFQSAAAPRWRCRCFGASDW